MTAIQLFCLAKKAHLEALLIVLVLHIRMLSAQWLKLVLLQDVIQQVGQQRPEQLAALLSSLEMYLHAVIGPQGQGRLLVSRGQGIWEWGADMAAAARLLQGLTLAADVVLPKAQTLIPLQYKNELPQRWATYSATDDVLSAQAGLTYCDSSATCRESFCCKGKAQIPAAVNAAPI